MISKDKLVDLYVRQDLKISDVALELDISVYRATKAIKSHNIKIKGVGHYNKHPRIEFTKKQYEFFDGLMASDGSLVIAKSDGRVRNAKISCAFKYKEMSEYINNFLCLSGNVHKKVHNSPRYKSGMCVQYGLFSRNNVLFTEEHARWYKNNIKVLPSDFRFSPTSMNILYLCDGHLLSGRGIILSLQSFDKNNLMSTVVDHLNKINIRLNINKNGEIYIIKASVPDFLKYIGKCPLGQYKYKWR